MSYATPTPEQVEVDAYTDQFVAAVHTEQQQRDRQETVTQETLGDTVAVYAGVVASVDTNTHEVHVTPDDGSAELIAGYGSLTSLGTADVGQRAIVLVPSDSRQPIFDVLWTTD